MPLKFGKDAPKPHPKTLLLDKYLLTRAVGMPAPERARGWEYAVPDEVWAESMLGNDEYGDCVEAMALHFIMMATAVTGNPVTFTKAQAVQLYTAITGFNPADPSTDNGTAITDLLSYWQTKGIFGHFIKGWAAFDWRDPVTMDQAIDIFGAGLVGIQVTKSMEDQFAAKQPWNPPYKGGVLGGHGIPILGEGRRGRTCITWAKRQQQALEFAKNIDEAYVVITDDFLKDGMTPLKINLEALQADLQAIAA